MASERTAESGLAWPLTPSRSQLRPQSSQGPAVVQLVCSVAPGAALCEAHDERMAQRVYAARQRRVERLLERAQRAVGTAVGVEQ
eukprot:6667616-Prymnesium_polylepis.1